MSKHRSLRIDEHFDRFIEERVGTIDYETANDVVRAGLVLLEEREIALERMREAFDGEVDRPMSLAELRAAIKEGEDSGEAVELDFDTFFEECAAQALDRKSSTS